MANLRQSASTTSVKNYKYSCIALKYNLQNEDSLTLWHLGYKYLLNNMLPLTNKSVLDIGRDNGVFTNLLHELGANVMSIDIAGNRVSLVGNGFEHKNISYEIKPGELDFLPLNSFDFVVSRFVFGTLSYMEGILRIMKTINRSLREDGSFIIMNENWDKSNGKEFVSFRMDYRKVLSSGRYVTTSIKSNPPTIQKDFYWSKEDYSDLLSKSGFEIYSIEEPLIRGGDLNWLSETSSPPYFIIFAKKNNIRIA